MKQEGYSSDNDIPKIIKGILKRVKGDYFDVEKDLVSGGFLTSFDIVEVVDELEKYFGIELSSDGLDLNLFDDVKSIEKIIISKIKCR